MARDLSRGLGSDIQAAHQVTIGNGAEAGLLAGPVKAVGSDGAALSRVAQLRAVQMPDGKITGLVKVAVDGFAVR